MVCFLIPIVLLPLGFRPSLGLSWRHRAHPLFLLNRKDHESEAPQALRDSLQEELLGAGYEGFTSLPAEEGGPSPLHLKHTYLCMRFHYRKCLEHFF